LGDDVYVVIQILTLSIIVALIQCVSIVSSIPSIADIIRHIPRTPIIPRHPRRILPPAGEGRRPIIVGDVVGDGGVAGVVDYYAVDAVAVRDIVSKEPLAILIIIIPGKVYTLPIHNIIVTSTAISPRPRRHTRLVKLATHLRRLCVCQVEWQLVVVVVDDVVCDTHLNCCTLVV